MDDLFGEYSFIRYLAAKVTVDDRALNQGVWQALASHLPASDPDFPLKVLEVGAGIGTMVERALSQGWLTFAEYHAIDHNQENIDCARSRILEWARENSYGVEPMDAGILLEKGAQCVKISFEKADLFDLFERQSDHRHWDLMMAHAFLDLIDLPSSLPRLLSLGAPGSLFYFSLNFDGETIFEPAIDPDFDDLVIQLYHQTMDDRLIQGKPSGDSRTGRHLFQALPRAGGEILAAGSSDWVVFGGPKGYFADEAYFLHFIIHTIHEALIDQPSLDRKRFSSWIAARHSQVERGELIYITHQMDFAGQLKEI